jgi:hyaluronan synthase
MSLRENRGGSLVSEIFKLIGFSYLLCCPLIVSSYMIMATVLAAALPGVVHIIRHRSSDFLWSFPFTAFWVTALSWTSLYALFTPHRSKWLTRKLTMTNIRIAPANID